MSIVVLANVNIKSSRDDSNAFFQLTLRRGKKTPGSNSDCPGISNEIFFKATYYHSCYPLLV